MKRQREQKDYKAACQIRQSVNTIDIKVIPYTECCSKMYIPTLRHQVCQRYSLLPLCLPTQLVEPLSFPPQS